MPRRWSPRACSPASTPRNSPIRALDAENKSLGDELARIGFKGEEPVGGRPVHAYFELHIEQGPILEDENIDVGVVTHGQGQRWYEIKLTGFESHAGSTPMPAARTRCSGRRGLSRWSTASASPRRRSASRRSACSIVYPNSRNVIPGEVFMACEFRHPLDATLSEMDAALHEGVKAICADIGLTYELKQIFYYAPVAFDAECVSAVRRAAQRFGYSHRDIVSGAGHDACYMARVAPSSMVFTPASTASAITRARTSSPNGRPQAPMF